MESCFSGNGLKATTLGGVGLRIVFEEREEGWCPHRLKFEVNKWFFFFNIKLRKTYFH